MSVGLPAPPGPVNPMTRVDDFDIAGRVFDVLPLILAYPSSISVSIRASSMSDVFARARFPRGLP